MGGISPDYQEIYQELDARAASARLTIVGDFEQPLRAGYRPDEVAAICTLTRNVWNRLQALAGDVSLIKAELRRQNAADIFDESEPFTLRSFQVRAYRRGA